MRGIIVFEDLFDPDPLLRSQADVWGASLRDMDDMPFEVLHLPWSDTASPVSQLFGLSLLLLDRYEEICVLQPQGLALTGQSVFFLSPDGPKGGTRSRVTGGEIDRDVAMQEQT